MKTYRQNFTDFIKLKCIRPFLLHLGTRMAKHSATCDYPVFPNPTFSWNTLLEENYEPIKKELEAIMKHHHRLPNLQDLQQEQQMLTNDNDWKTFFFYGYGQKAVLNCESCPFTTYILEQIPDLQTAFFSILSPGKHINAHRGIFNGLVRAHLGLIIPSPSARCRIRIDQQIISWKEGKVFMFDDTYEHEVWNDTDDIRVILLIDVTRPYKFPLSVINNYILGLIRKSSFVTGAFKKNEAWEKTFHQNRKSGRPKNLVEA